MSLDLIEQHTVANDGEFIARLKMALLARAAAVMVEDSDDAHNGTDVYVAKMGFAQQILSDPQGTAERAAQLAAVTAAHVDASEMGDVAYTAMADSVFLPLAGYSEHYVMATE